MIGLPILGKIGEGEGRGGKIIYRRRYLHDYSFLGYGIAS